MGDTQRGKHKSICVDTYQHSDCSSVRQLLTLKHTPKLERQGRRKGEKQEEVRESFQSELHEVNLQGHKQSCSIHRNKCVFEVIVVTQ